MSLGCVLALAGLGLWGCDPGDAEDAGPGTTDGGTDAGPMDTLVVMAFDGTNEVAADLSCMGTRTAPAAGAAMDFPGRTQIVGAGGTMAVPNVAVQLFPSNVVPDGDDTCSGDCVEFTSDGGGGGTISLGNAWHAYRILGTGTGAAETLTVVAYNDDTRLTASSTLPMGTAPAIEFSLVSAGLFSGALGAALVQVDPGTGMLTGGAFDCVGNALVNVRLRVFNDSGEVVSVAPRAMGTRIVYWALGGIFPMSDLAGTSAEGRYAVANIPVGGTVRVELWGRASDADTGESMIGCEEISGEGDRLTLINVGPTRMDGPSGCSM